MHLLMENALGDSRSYEVLAPDEVDSIKRELSILGPRIEATQRKLVLESKVRDATNSMGRLQKPGMANGVGRSVEEAEEAARKCDELGQELWKMEKQEQQLTKTLLEHNAAILQMTHKGYLKNKPEANADSILDDYESSDFGDLSHYKPSSLTLYDLLLGSGPDVGKQDEMIIDIGRRVEDLNAMIRDMMQKSNTQQRDMPRSAQGMQNGSDSPENILHEQIDYMENCLRTMQHSQKDRGFSEEKAQAAEQDLQNVNEKIFQNLSRLGAAIPEPPEPTGQSLSLQIDYLSNAFGNIVQQLDENDRYESVIGGLWTTLASPQEANEFSLQRFSAKVQEMQIRFSGLQEQKDVLARQVQQQRELNESADHVKDTQINDLSDQLDATRSELENTRQETNIHLERLTSAMEELDAAKARIAHTEQSRQQRGLAESQALEQERQARINLESQLQQAMTEATTKAAEFQKADEAAKEMEAQFVRAQTELTIARAELDSAHGSRAQRAAEIAGDPVLQARIQKLETELHETISDYEAMTKSTIEYEKEREQFESTIDQLRDRAENLETQLNEERIHALGAAKSPGQSSDRGGSGATSAAVLRNEFKKMMRDTRAEHTKALRVRCVHSIILKTFLAKWSVG